MSKPSVAFGFRWIGWSHCARRVVRQSVRDAVLAFKTSVVCSCIAAGDLGVFVDGWREVA